MNAHVERVLDEILENLNNLVAAETEAAVRVLQGKIEEAIQEAGKELRSKCLLHHTRQTPENEVPEP